jgi:hypothetical protein
MSITITTKRLKTQLVTLADLTVAIVPGSADDVFLASLINRATNHFERECRRVFGRQVVTETFNGNRRTDILVSHIPVMNLASLTHSGSTITATEYRVEDKEAGILFMENGWIENRMVMSGITTSPLDQVGDSDYSLIYTSGYLLPGDNIIAGDAFIDCAADATAKTFTRTSGKWPLLVDGDCITFGGFAATGLNIEYTVASRTDLVITVDETPTNTEAAGATVTLTCQTLPEELEQAAIELINSWFAGRGRDSTLKAEKIGDWSATYGAAIPEYVQSIVNHYKVIF